VTRRYERPPVVEALCEIVFEGSEWDSTIPGLFYERIRERFPEKADVPSAGLELGIAEQQATARVHVGPRVRFMTAERSLVVQLERDLLVVNQLQPYPRFDVWRPVVLEMLQLYRELVRPKMVRRMGVRYLNQMAAPTTAGGLPDYLRVYPAAPAELLPEQEFLLRLGIRPEHPAHEVTLTLNGTGPGPAGVWAVLLDIYDNVDTAAAAQSNGAGLVEKYLDEAHANIVSVFEGAITDAARTLFKEVADGSGS
jgi:uncharacterized protein (TIGR04255 family)